MTSPTQTSRYGFYYFPDNLHYREIDIKAWIPELRALGAAWLTLLAPVDRAIPEAFIRPLIEAGIQPIIHMPLSTSGQIVAGELGVVFAAYARWGIRYIALFDKPNLQKNWSPNTWTQKNLVERFVDMYIPIAETALAHGLVPVFPPLEPGGDYWDTAFLYTALQGLQRRNRNELLDKLVLSANAWSGNRSPNWGAGGPERWPNARPYATPQNSEDQLGFRIFDWYLALAQAALGKTLPILLLAAGSRIGDQQDPAAPAVDAQAHAWQNMAIIRSISGQNQEYDPVPAEVLACNFWVLSAGQNDPEAQNAWYQPDSQQLPAVGLLKDWIANQSSLPVTSSKFKPAPVSKYSNPRPIAHYLLLPTSERDQVEWHLETVRPFINKFKPTIGFSPIEAMHAQRVTVIAGSTSVPEAIIDGLLAAGCVVEQIGGDGMNIASKLTSPFGE